MSYPDEQNPILSPPPKKQKIGSTYCCLCKRGDLAYVINGICDPCCLKRFGLAVGNVSKNKRAEQLMGRRISLDDETKGVVCFSQPFEEGYVCPICSTNSPSKKNDESLHWSEYNGFLWCRKCNLDIPTLLCTPHDNSRESIIRMTSLFLDLVSYAARDGDNGDGDSELET